RGGPLHDDVARARGLAPSRDLGELRAGVARLALVDRIDPDEGGARERRESELAPIRELTLQEGVDVVPRRERDRRVLGVPRLDEDAPGDVAAPGAPRHPDEELERP